MTRGLVKSHVSIGAQSRLHGDLSVLSLKVSEKAYNESGRGGALQRHGQGFVGFVQSRTLLSQCGWSFFSLAFGAP